MNSNCCSWKKFLTGAAIALVLACVGLHYFNLFRLHPKEPQNVPPTLPTPAILTMAPEPPTISTESGPIKGLLKTTYNGVKYKAFFGIPYAEPPLGELRFKAPKPVKPWREVYEATSEKPISVQMSWRGTSGVTGSEDCLYLNVYVPETRETQEPLPVVIWIHGGAFSFNSGNFDVTRPDYFMAEEVIFVTINYRLSVFGFLSFDDPSLNVPGNAGLKDQLLAIKWIKTNIVNFGGDPENITLMGESAGAASVNILSTSPKTTGLYNRIIMQSASGLNLWVVGNKKYKWLGKELGCSNNTQKEIFERVKKASTEELVRAVGNIFNEDMENYGLPCPFSPVIEYPHEDAIITEPLEAVIRRGNYQDRAILAGLNSDEGGIAFTRSTVSINFTDNELLIPRDVNIKHGSDESKALGLKIKEFYYGKSKPSEERPEEYLKFQSDVHMNYKFYKAISYQKANTKSPVFFYEFNYKTPQPYMTCPYIKRSISNHGDEMDFMFYRDVKRTQELIDPVAVHRIVKLWTNFMKTGNPNPKDTDELLNVKWKSVGEKFWYLLIAPDMELKVDPFRERMRFWDEVYSMNKN